MIFLCNFLENPWSRPRVFRHVPDSDFISTRGLDGKYVYMKLKDTLELDREVRILVKNNIMSVLAKLFFKIESFLWHMQSKIGLYLKNLVFLNIRQNIDNISLINKKKF